MRIYEVGDKAHHRHRLHRQRPWDSIHPSIILRIDKRVLPYLSLSLVESNETDRSKQDAMERLQVCCGQNQDPLRKFHRSTYQRNARVVQSHDSPFPTCMWTIVFRLASRPHFSRSFSASQCRPDFHFDTHHFVQRLEREGLNRAQAEGIMSAMAEVIDESIRNMTSNMVTKAEQEKVWVFPIFSVRSPKLSAASLYPTSGFCTN